VGLSGGLCNVLALGKAEEKQPEQPVQMTVTTMEAQVKAAHHHHLHHPTGGGAQHKEGKVSQIGSSWRSVTVQVQSGGTVHQLRICGGYLAVVLVKQGLDLVHQLLVVVLQADDRLARLAHLVNVDVVAREALGIHQWSGHAHIVVLE